MKDPWPLSVSVVLIIELIPIGACGCAGRSSVCWMFGHRRQRGRAPALDHRRRLAAWNGGFATSRRWREWTPRVAFAGHFFSPGWVRRTTMERRFVTSIVPMQTIFGAARPRSTSLWRGRSASQL